MDIALAIESIVPLADYTGSTTENTQAAFDSLVWNDERPKPSWADINAEWLVLAKTALKSHAAERRWQVETGGVVVSGVPVSTTETSQSKIDAALSAFDRGTITGTIKFKSATGAFVDVDLATLTAIYNAVVAHVQQSYVTEETVVAAIDAETITTLAEVDGAAWPANG